MIRIVLFILISFSVKAQTVYKTPKGAKYHLATCRMVNNVSEALSITKAHQMRLEACKICKPPLNANASYNLTKNAAGQKLTTTQCRGMTKAGNRCLHKTSISNGYCFQHDPSKRKP